MGGPSVNTDTGRILVFEVDIQIVIVVSKCSVRMMDWQGPISDRYLNTCHKPYTLNPDYVQDWPKEVLFVSLPSCDRTNNNIAATFCYRQNAPKTGSIFLITELYSRWENFHVWNEVKIRKDNSDQLTNWLNWISVQIEYLDSLAAATVFFIFDLGLEKRTLARRLEIHLTTLQPQLKYDSKLHQTFRSSLFN